MRATGPPAISQLLARWREGDHESLRALVPLLYDELRRVAHMNLRHARPDHTLQTTALVHETHLRLEKQHAPQFQNREHFVAVCALLMRQILTGYSAPAGPLNVAAAPPLSLWTTLTPPPKAPPSICLHWTTP